MEHFNILYLLVTALIGMTSLGVAVAEYVRNKETLLRSYIYFYAALTLELVSELLFSYVLSNLPELRPLIGALHYLNVFVAKYAIMVTFPAFIHAFFAIPGARKRDLVFLVLAALLFLEDHVVFFLLRPDKPTIVDNLDNLVLMLVIFYGFVTALAEYKHCEPDKAGLAKRLLVMLGVFMPAIIVDALLYDTFPLMLYPVVYCWFSLDFTQQLTRYAAAHSQVKPSALPAEAGDLSAGGAENLLTEALYRRYNISLRERDVLPLLLQGASNQQIAEALCISLNTVKAHIRSINAKFDVKNRYELFAFLKHGDEALLPRAEAVERDRT